MKVIKKSLIICMVMLLLICTESLKSVLAFNSTEPNISVQNQIGNIGEEINVDILMKNNPGIAGAILQIEYSPKLVLKGVDNGDALDSLIFTKPGKLSSPCRFLWDSERGMSKKDGVLLTLHFLISDKSVIGEKLPVHISYEEGDIYDENLDDISIDLKDGTITVSEGDVPALSLSQNGSKLTAILSKTDSVTGYGFVYGKGSEVTLNTQGRVRLAFTELDEGDSFTYDISGLEEYSYRAYVTYTDGNGDEKIKYSERIYE